MHEMSHETTLKCYKNNRDSVALENIYFVIKWNQIMEKKFGSDTRISCAYLFWRFHGYVIVEKTCFDSHRTNFLCKYMQFRDFFVFILFFTMKKNSNKDQTITIIWSFLFFSEGYKLTELVILCKQYLRLDGTLQQSRGEIVDE